jgi:Tol biopolymer transport system component
MRLIRLLICLIAVPVLSACESLDKIVWSPDGSKVAVLADSGIKFGDAQGTLSQSTSIKAKLFRWLPDGKRAVVVIEKTGCTWAEMKPLLSKAEVDKAISDSEEVWNFHGTMAQLDQRFSKQNGSSDFVLPYLESKYGRPALIKKLNELNTKISPSELSEIGGFYSTYSVQLLTIEEKIESGPVLLQSASEIADLRVSPKGDMVLVSENKGSKGCDLYLAFVGGQRPAKWLESGNANYPDWNADGTQIIFVQANRPVTEEGSTNGTVPLGMIRTCHLDYRGGTLTQRSGSVLGWLPFSREMRLRTLPNGKILFNADVTELPCTDQSFKKKGSLYELSSDGKTLEKIQSKGDPLGNDLSHFEINKAGTKVVVASNTGAVTVLDLETGAVNTVEKISKDATGSELKFNPSWRNEDELCFSHRSVPSQFEVVLQSVSKQDSRVISSKWPVHELKFLGN